MRKTRARRAALTCGAALGFFLLYEATAFDSRAAVSQATHLVAAAVDVASAPLRFTATAYCKGTTTASGVPVRSGIAAADPRVLPVGSIVRTSTLGAPYDGIYTVMDTGPLVRGNRIDLYIWSCTEALRFGRRTALLDVLRLGWNPGAVTPEALARLFSRRPVRE